MKLLGLTGGIGMGKSTAAKLLGDLAVPIIDTDLIARRVVEPGQPALEELRVQFGPEIIGRDGRLRREELARRVFADPTARVLLESILHPPIREAWLAQVAEWRRENRGVGVVVIPLLFETNAAGNFDATICVACSAVTQMNRLRARGWTQEQISQRIQAQWPVEKKMARADFVIWTEGSLEIHDQQLRRVLGVIQP
jgi:dephospho-CoA kinase